MARYERYPGQRSLERMLRDSRRKDLIRRRETMTLPEVQDAIRAAVAERFARDGEEAEIGMALFREKNLPLHLVDPAFVRGVITAVRTEMQEQRA